MAEAKISALDITINGMLSPSLLASVNRAEAILKSFGVSQKTQAAAMARVYNQAFGSMATSLGKVKSAWQGITEMSVGVALGQGLFAGFESGVKLIGDAVEGMKDLAIHASDAAAKFELISLGMGAILRDQGFANNLLDQLQIVADKSPFQLMDMGNIARQLSGRGMGKNQLFGATTELGDITAGLGGDTEILGRLSLAYGEAFDQEAVDKRIMRQFSMAGVPILDALMTSFGMNPKNAGQIQTFLKMVHDKQVSFKDLDKAIYQLTHDGGLFTDGMIHFAETFTGISRTFLDKLGKTSRDFGFIINDWVGSLLKFVNTSDIWNDVHIWLLNLRQVSQSVLSIAHTLPTGVISAVFEEFEGVFNGFNKWLGQYFNRVEIPNSGNVIVLNATGDKAVRDAFKQIEDILEAFRTFMDSPNVKNLASWTMSEGIIRPLDSLFHNLSFIIKIMADLTAWDLPALGKDFKEHNDWFENEQKRHREEREAREAPIKAAEEQAARYRLEETMQDDRVNNIKALEKNTEASDALQKIIDALNEQMKWNADRALDPWRGPGTRGPDGIWVPGSLQDSPTHDSTYFEYDDEGPSSQYGPKGNRLGDDYGVGVSEWNMAHGHKIGNWVKIRTPNGKIIYRQINEHATRDIEFHTKRGREGDYGEGKSQILEDYGPNKPPVTINYNVHAIDAVHVASFARQHAELIAEHVQRVFDDGYARSAAV